MGEILGFLVAAALALWFVADTLRAREAAIATARHLCRQEGLLFLDESAALSGLRLVRAPHGPMAIQRTYAFEFSDTGDNRRTGQITLHGARVIMTYTGIRAEPTPPAPDQIG